MATTLCKFPSFISLSYHKPFLYHQEEYNKLCCNNYEHPPKRDFAICSCSIKNPSRRSRKVKSNVELCDDLREFVSTVGLPEGSVPSLKELQHHGRNDLANIVRRRGYKLIRDLLSSTTEADTKESNMERNLAGSQDATSADIPTGQDDKVKYGVEDSCLSTECSISENNSENSDIDSENKSDGQHCMALESAAELSLEGKDIYDLGRQDEEIHCMAEDRLLSTPSDTLKQQDEKVECIAEQNTLSTPVYDVEQQSEKVLSMVEHNSMPSEVSDADLGNLNVMVSHQAADFSLLTEVSTTEYRANSINATPTDSSLEEKVAKFIENGDLDAIEYNVYGVLNENGTEESKGFGEPENTAEIQSKQSYDNENDNFEHQFSRNNRTLAVNGTLLTSTQVMAPMRIKNPVRNELPTEGAARTHVDKDVETSKRDSEVEVKHLKFMLHQKEMELSKLKEQIDKEKLALSTLKTKAETEISKAQKLLSEKDAELLAAEESLSGLVEVKIEYRGNGIIVEVAGSFNGWHHLIKMDLQPSCCITESVGSRESRLWSTILWLYPGVYEIKFIVDGHWMVDPQRESVTRGGISNNILRVVL